jgi:hypothetical protein
MLLDTLHLNTEVHAAIYCCTFVSRARPRMGRSWCSLMTLSLHAAAAAVQTRGQLSGINWNNAVIIIDEAHNIQVSCYFTLQTCSQLSVVCATALS